METYLYYPPKARAKRVPYSLLKVGDPDCQHRRDGYKLVTEGRIAFAQFTCTQCGRVVAHNVGEILAPESWGQL